MKPELSTYKFIEKYIPKIKNSYSNKVLKCIKGQSLVSTNEELDKKLDYYIDNVLDLKWMVEDMIGERDSTIQLRVDQCFEKIIWLKSEESLIELFNKLLEFEFIVIEGDLYSNLSLHFIPTQRINLATQSNIPYSKIIWKKAKNDLAYLFKNLIGPGFIEISGKHHIVIASHITCINELLKPSTFRNSLDNVSSRDYIYIPSETIKFIVESLKY